MLTKNLLTFCERDTKYKQRFSPFEVFEKLGQDIILEILCEFLMQPECTKDVAECFSEFLPALVSMAISADNIQSSSLLNKDFIHRLNCVILGKLIDINPNLLVFVLCYFDVNPSPFEPLAENSSDSAASIKRQNTRKLPYNVSEVSEYDIVTACHSILYSATKHFKYKWNWSKFYKYLTNTDNRIKWIALKCLATVLNMSHSTRLLYAQIFIPNFEEFLIEYEDTSTDTSINTSVACASFESIEDAVKNISSVISVAGVLLPTRSKTKYTDNLVLVPTTRKNLQSLAMAIGSRKCICLQGPVGCGKTALVEHLARLTGHDSSTFIKVQLGDQTDSKMLLGMYRCTDVPGEFVWQPGVLTQAVVAGKWLLLEDIDSAGLDVASVLNNLMETGTLCVPGYRDTIYANSGFQLFVTQRLMMSVTGIQKHVTGPSSLLQKHWLCLNVEPLSKDELVTVVQTLFPALSTIATKIVDVFLLFSVGDHDSDSDTNSIILSLKIGRQTSTRDLLKWCSRAIVDFDVSSSESALKMFQDALDVFCSSVSDQTQRLNLAVAVANKLGIIKTKAEYFCNIHKPGISLLPEVLVVGRAKMPRKRVQYAKINKEKTHFSFTRTSSCLLERIASCVLQKEPVLLVGETGTGKTSTVQYLAKYTGHRLTIINMNQQSESADLLGGYKPVDLKYLISPIREEFEILFRSYFVIESNKKFLEHIATCYKQQKWKNLITLMSHSSRAAVKRLRDKLKEDFEDDAPKDAGQRSKQSKISRKKRTDYEQPFIDILMKWERMLEKLDKLGTQVKSQHALTFSFIEGSLVKALRNGYWVLLDEINLANAETLECLSGLLEGSSESLSLLERGDGEPVKRHPDFTMFACMNPATDVGKKDLPVGLRNRFTEFYIDELTERSDLELLVRTYLAELNLPPEKHEAIVKFYLNVRKEATNVLFDGTAHKPHYSLRTLCRALYISASNPCGSVLRSMYEAFSLSFLTQLNHDSYPIVQKMIARAILDKKNVKAILGTPISKPKCGPEDEYVCVEGYWVLQGSLTPETPSNYILTDSVRRNLKDLVRVVSIGKIPVLLQGDTSVGKTSLITYLAKITGHVCVRINNHEHTDLQEYVGSYVADETGKLVFQEGVLVDAMRRGHWIILDELNLAPSDVLEALNRVLDDNRELFIPETQQVVKAHERFMLFATQNPPGLYGGRKVLSRAFRNRFVELHFDEIPPNELQTILNKRCSMPESYCKQVINVMTDLQLRRKGTAAFAGKKGFITLRDLFRWGERYRLAPDVGNKLYDWSQHLADEGYLVLAAKVRKSEEANEIRDVIKKHLKRDVNPDTLFTLSDKTSPVTRHILEEISSDSVSDFGHIVWTYHMRRMAVLVKKSCQFKEPVLLVGETGGGKTTICQLIAAINGQTMRSVNCHMHTESSDFLGNLRPVREHTENDQRLFEWVDGPLINAMRNGDLFLADEISLADDSVLERLNSLLESERSLLLAEKGIESSQSKENTVIVANEKFVFVGTMNPSGDFGKKELSPALRNRFTEIWCEGCTARSDLQDIIVHNLRVDSRTTKESVAIAILRFTEWLRTTEVGEKLTVSIRDILTWVNFINTCTSEAVLSKLTIGEAYYHGACLTYIDSLGSGATGSENINKLKDFAKAAVRFINSEVKNIIKSELNALEPSLVKKSAFVDEANIFGVPPFYIKKNSHVFNESHTFMFTTTTTKMNTLKLLRALQLSKPILLEGSPGVGKTSLVSALAKAVGHPLIRINLSDQTDVSDLFGADLPVEGGKSGEFAWRDGPFLRALRSGYWILLDELNLASQSVLEGLNACFDHRGEVYIPELGKTFSVKPGTRLFGCQNPLRQGGDRRGLPRSFLNRFTQVFVDALMETDLKFILNMQFPQLPADMINNMVKFNNRLASEVGVAWGHSGAPWEMNLRDISRWCQTTIKTAYELNDNNPYFNPSDSVELIYVDRMRSYEDRQKIYHMYQEMFSPDKYPLPPNQLPMHITADTLYIGDVTLSRKNCCAHEDCNLLVLRDQKSVLKSLMQCVKMNWMSILVGASGCGKSNVVRLLAALTGQKLRSIAMNSAMDTTEILGGFEQTDYNRHLEQLFERAATLLIDSLRAKISVDELEQAAELHERLIRVRRLFDENVVGRTMDAETKLFLHKIEELSKLATATRRWEPSHELELRDIESRLRSLSIFVKQDKCLNAGGKFEWVDSVLVKCLQDGTWLLIDQVNLCSPAVLDRLNGLLEPNGVLSIGERGVDGDGNIVTIKPHENFRLFLTMDPRYGEISRAMRNRGVEIYMLDPRKNVDRNAIDLRSLVFNAGVVKSTHRDALLEIYGKMSEESVAVDRLSVIDLLHTAFLVRQRSLRGYPAKQLIRDACIDVYIKARPTRDPRLRERSVAPIDRIIERYVTRDNETSVIDLDAATWSVNNLHDNPGLTVIRQQGLLLRAAVGMYKLRGELNTENNGRDVITTKLLNDFCDLGEDDEFALNVDVADEVLPHFLLNFYELSSRNDAPLRQKWLAKILRGNAMFDELEKRSASMAKVIALFSFRSAENPARSSLPWDSWQLAGRTTDDKDDDTSDTAKLSLLLYASSMILESGVTPTEALKKKSVISVKQYSTAVLEGEILSQLKNQPLVTYFARFLERANFCVAAILRDSNVSANPEGYVEARRELKWYTRFERLGEMTLINKSEKSKAIFTNLEQISLLLKVHYKWLLKFLHKLFAVARKFPSERTASEIERLLDIADTINDQLESVYDPMKKISKRIKKHLILPSPHPSETSMNVHSRLRAIARDFSVRDESGGSLKQELKFLSVQLKDSLTMRYRTISLWRDIYSGEPIDDATVLEVERYCDESHIRLRVPAEIESALSKVRALPGAETARLNGKIRLWPIYEYVFLSLACALQGEACLRGTISTSAECLARFADVPSIPSNLISLLSAMARKEVERGQKTLLLPELFCRLEQFTRQSYAVRDASRLLHWRGITEEDLERSLTSYAESKESYFGGPVLLNLVLKLMLRKTNEGKEKSILSVIELGTYTAQINQLQLLGEILWRNSISLTNKRYDLTNSDLTTLRSYLHVYLSAIDKLHSEHNVSELIATAIKKQGGNRAADIENRLRVDYFEPLEELRESRDEIRAIDDENLTREGIALRRGRAWMLLGYVQLQVFGNLDLIDPVHKVELKLKYVEEDIVDCRRTMYVTTLQNRIQGMSSENKHAHPRFRATRDCERQLMKTRDELSCANAFRPRSVSFTSLSSDSADFRHRVGSYELVKKHTSRLRAVASKIASEECELADLKVAETASREAESWSSSVQRFAEQIEAKYLSAYPDVILPLMAALAQMSHGVGILINEIRRLISLRKKKVADLDSLIYNLIRFPTIDQQQESLLSLSDLCVGRNIRNLINESSCSADTFVRMREQFRMLKSGLRELYNHVILNRGLTRSLWRDLNELLQQIVLIWKQQRQEEEKRIAEKDSLYENKIENHDGALTEEEELALEVREMFPTHRERDFHDIEDDSEAFPDQKSTKNASSEPDETQSSFSGLITKDDIGEIQKIHSNIVTSFTVSKWIRINPTSIPSTNYVEPLTQRYCTVHGMLDDILPSLSEELAVKLYNSLSFLVTLGLQENRETDRVSRESIEKSASAYDFYKDSNVEEVKRCLPLCENILNRIDQLLEQWPDHPTLRSIRCIIERIYTFSITSPVSRFLTGLELLLVKMHQWEENAHKGVSLSDHILTLTEQIISWRRLELSCWKGCLDAAHETLRSDTSKWWFFLYALIESYITRNDIEKADGEFVTKQKLVESLERFMDESSLVEFESRLHLLLTFHCHVCYLDDSDDKNEILAVLWNVYNYYKQFVDDVNARIAALKAPIEKKLKDFVKIARWNDISYWAVKETVEKTHRTLHKFVKEFQKALKQEVSSCLAVKSGSYNAEVSKGIWDDQDHRKYVIIPEDFTVTKSSSTVGMKVLFSGLIAKTNTLLAKAKHLCKEIVLMSSYPFVRSELENFIGDFMEQSARLRDTDIDRSLPKSKQKSQAKSILQQKKLMLANYFKALLQMGVSYRAGVLMLKNNADQVTDFTVSPLDLSVISQYFKLRNIDHHMLMQWQGCEKYYYRSLIRLNALNAMLSTRQTDLGLQNMERCRGFSAHMMLMAHRQKKTIIQSFESFSSLRIQISNLTETREGDLGMSRQRDGQDCTETLKTLLITLEAGLEQLLLLLRCCPAESSTDANRAVLTLDTNALPIIAACQNDEVWKNADALLKCSLNLIKVTAKRFHVLFMPFEVLSVSQVAEYHARASFLSSKHFEFLEQCRATIEVVKARNGELKQLFENSDVAHPIRESVIFLDTKMERFLAKCENLRKVAEVENDEQSKVNSDAVKRYELGLEQLMNTILLVIQKKYKDNVNVNDEVADVREKLNEENDEDDNDVEEEIEESRLSKKLIEFLERDITELKLPKIYDSFFSLLLSIREFDLQSANYCIRLLLQCLPLLEQYVFLAQFYLNEQVAAFRVTCKMLYLQLNVFLDLAANGFCMPKDLDLEEGETDESGERIEKGGMGLADGEGTKDVSDRIESEDQLEDARPADQEQEKQDDRTCKEEEKGIEMSEDFDSKPQDIEKGDDDEEQDDDENENDLDKEMGETGEGAEQLDKEIWGDDAEESEENNQQNDDEEEGTGEQTGEKEMGAKDDRDKRRQHDDDDISENREEGTQKEINEMKEPEVDEDQINPYHGKFDPPPEPEPLDLPEDINLDDDGKEDNGDEEVNPFDIDEMKNSKPPPEKKDEEFEKDLEENKENDAEEDSSEEENENSEDMDASGQKTQKEPETNEETEENNKAEGMQKEDEEQQQDKQIEEEKLPEKAAPSVDDASKEMDAASQVEETTGGSRDTIAEQPVADNEDKQEASAENTQQDNDDKGTGQSQSAQQESGHSGSSKQETTPIPQKNATTEPVEKRRNLGERNEDRSLLDWAEPALKKLKTTYTRDEARKDEKEEDDSGNSNTVDLAQHIKDSEKFDDYTLDAATEDQAREQASNIEKENQDKAKDDAMDIDVHEDEESTTHDEITEQQPEIFEESETTDSKHKETDGKCSNAKDSQPEATEEIEMELEEREAMLVQRAPETTFHTMELSLENGELDSGHVEGKRFEVEKMLSEWTQIPPTEEAAAAWNCLCSITDAAARDLSEKLRLVLEPTQLSRLKGDYKTGKRINMRKIIPYIASEFRKDKIWLRRTKASKRDYQIILALDDSRSMMNNQCKEMTFESLSLISKAMMYLEVGKLGIVSFGESVKVLHPLGETFTEQSGSRIIQEMRFNQELTRIAQLLDFTVDMFESQHASSDHAKLLVVLSDGRNVYADAINTVKRAVRRARLLDIFLVFIIIDNPNKKDSILDIVWPVFGEDQVVEFKSYMDFFPFPFYIHVRDMNTLPGVLSDALRQWFELVGKIDI